MVDDRKALSADQKSLGFARKTAVSSELLAGETRGKVKYDLTGTRDWPLGLSAEVRNYGRLWQEKPPFCCFALQFTSYITDY
jgi:hypothetical protein